MMISASPLATSRNLSGETLLHLLKALMKARLWERTPHNALVITLSSNECNSFWIFIDFWNCFVRVSNHYLLSWYQWINKYNILVMTEFKLRRFKLVYIYQNDIYIMTETAKNHRNKKKNQHNSHICKIFFLRRCVRILSHDIMALPWEIVAVSGTINLLSSTWSVNRYTCILFSGCDC